MTGEQRSIQPLDLLAVSTGIPALEESGFSEKRLLAALSEFAASYGEILEPATGLVRTSQSAAHLPRNPGDSLLCRYSSAQGIWLQIAMSRGLFERLFTRNFGGDASVQEAMPGTTPAQQRFANRLAPVLLAALLSAWPALDRLLLSPDFVGFEDGSGSDGHSVGPLTMVEATFAEHCVAITLPSALMAAVHTRARPSASQPRAGREGWRERLVSRACNVRLPVRSVLARPEIPAARLLQLQLGDVLPITMPVSVPVTVGRLKLGDASIGEAHGRAAIRIESLNKDTRP